MALKCSVKEQTSEMTTTKIFELIAVGIFKKLNFQTSIWYNITCIFTSFQNVNCVTVYTILKYFVSFHISCHIFVVAFHTLAKNLWINIKTWGVITCCHPPSYGIHCVISWNNFQRKTNVKIWIYTMSWYKYM